MVTQPECLDYFIKPLQMIQTSTSIRFICVFSLTIAVCTSRDASFFTSADVRPQIQHFFINHPWGGVIGKECDFSPHERKTTPCITVSPYKGYEYAIEPSLRRFLSSTAASPIRSSIAINSTAFWKSVISNSGTP